MQQEPKSRQHNAASRPAIGAIEVDLSASTELAIVELRTAWADRFGTDPPPIRSRDILLRLLAWRVQAERVGGLDAKTERKLRDIASALERDGSYVPPTRRELSPGVVLVREWKGVTHKVTATAAGFLHQGTRYRSLSEIARAITGTRWSGPRFFGFEQRRQPRKRGAP